MMASQLPIKPEIPSALLCPSLCTTRMDDETGKEFRWYAGEIEPDMTFAWEPDLPYARELVVVVRIAEAGDPITIRHARGLASISQGRGTLIWTRLINQPAALAIWNTESRFREAVVPTLFKFPPPAQR